MSSAAKTLSAAAPELFCDIDRAYDLFRPSHLMLKAQCSPCFQNRPLPAQQEGRAIRKGERKRLLAARAEGAETKIHALADAKGRFLAILLTGGKAHDYPVAKRLIPDPQSGAAQAYARRHGL